MIFLREVWFAFVAINRELWSVWAALAVFLLFKNSKIYF
jgi:hypothetical protein